VAPAEVPDGVVEEIRQTFRLLRRPQPGPQQILGRITRVAELG
jgi:hypothetical protein